MYVFSNCLQGLFIQGEPQMILISNLINDFGIDEHQKPLFWDKANAVIHALTEIRKSKNV